MSGKSHDNIDHMHTLVQQMQSLLEHLVEIGREELTSDYDNRMIDAFAQAVLTANHGLRTMHGIIDQDFEPITEEDVLTAFRQRRGITEHGPQQIAQESYTLGTVPLSELPTWEAPTFDPGTPERRLEQNIPPYRGRHGMEGETE